MKKFILLLIFVFIIFLFYGCSDKCETGLMTKDGKCCNYICEIDCPDGYVDGTCNCECKGGGYESEDTNIDDIFEDTEDINPPQLPNP